MTASHLVPQITDRGFKHMPTLADAFEPDAVRLLEASTAVGPHLWLRVKDPAEPGQHPVVLLSAEQAWKLKEQIEWLLEHHYHGDARPDEAR